MEYTNKILTEKLHVNITQVPTEDASFKNGDYFVNTDTSLWFKSNEIWVIVDASTLLQ